MPEVTGFCRFEKLRVSSYRSGANWAAMGNTLPTGRPGWLAITVLGARTGRACFNKFRRAGHCPRAWRFRRFSLCPRRRLWLLEKTE